MIRACPSNPHHGAARVTTARSCIKGRAVKIKDMVFGKYSIELNFCGSGVLYMNYWDCILGNDVVAEIKEGKIILNTRDNAGEELIETEISFKHFLSLVEKSINDR